MSAAHDTQALADALSRLTKWAVTMSPDTHFSGDHPIAVALHALASRLQAQEGQPALSEQLNGEGIGDLICAVERWKSARTGDASTSALNSLEALIVRLAATLAAGSQAVQVPAEATEAMADAVRPLIVAIEIAGRTYGSVRNHCERAGMDIDGWPDWARNEPAGAHFTKAACALLIWHCMQRAAAPLQPLAGGEVDS